MKIFLKKKINFDIIQVPYNVFDRRFEPHFVKLKKVGVEIHVRSVFLQGLVFKNPGDLTGDFSKISGKLKLLAELAKKGNTSISSVCLNFAVANKLIDKVVVGVDSIGNLREILKAEKDIDYVNNISGELLNLKEDDEQIILPVNWKVKK